MAETDVLDRLLTLAQLEGALGPERMADFAQGLRERARLVLEGRVQPLEQRVRDLEVAAAALEEENAWRRETVAALEERAAWLKQQAESLRGELEEVRREAESLRAARDQAAAAFQESEAVHDRLRAHHRDVVGRAVERFAAAAALPFWRFRECRSLLAEAGSLFARELA